MFTVRTARPEDAEEISALIAYHVPEGTLLPRSAEFVRERALEFLVAEEDGRLLGSVHLDEYAPSLCEVRSLAVHPSAQGKGVGVALVAALERLARRRRYATVFAVSNRDSFFLSRGFTPRHIPELDKERSEVSKFKGVFAKDLDELP
ncbi:MAG TPA: GNAT family N-acetyltransferase [Gemmatimonadaceae bacterium]|nr:GNAT family N-acetyltransferase [Gemmatimonadaceae bacterium]